MHQSHLQPFVDKLGANSVLTETEEQALLGLPGRLADMPANRDFVRLGETTSHACMIVDGLVARFDQTMAGHRQTTAFYVAGDMPDLHSVVLHQSASALQSLAPTTLVDVPHGAIRAVAARYPAIAEALWRECALDAAMFAQWIVNIGRRDAKARIAHLLCELAVRLKADLSGNRPRYDLGLTQMQMADATGLTAVHVNRTLMALRAAGLVTFSHGHVAIHDWEALMMMGEFDPAYLHVGLEPEARLRLVN